MIERASRNAAKIRRAVRAVALTLLMGLAPVRAMAEDGTPTDRLVMGYPGFVKSVRGATIEFRDGSSLPFDDGMGAKTFADWLDHPDVEDTFAKTYTRGPLAVAPGPEDDPGRARNEAFFRKIYGDCRKGEAGLGLVDIVWLPKKRRQVLKVTSRNGVAERLAAISSELDQLPARFDAVLRTEATTYNCRSIAGTSRMSAHSFGIAIDIAVKPSGYWRWRTNARAPGEDHSRDLPVEVVDIFEKHGFIWGGKWHHFDTMHFEYRPELCVPQAMPASGPAAPSTPPQ